MEYVQGRVGKVKTIDLSAYHKLKTASLFVASTKMGAIAAGEDPEPGQSLGKESVRHFRWLTI